MIQATDLKVGVTFKLREKPYKVLKYTHTKLGRGGANVKLSLRNLESGALEEKTFGSDEKVEEISTHKKVLQYLYADGKSAIFMDPKTFDHVEIPISLIENELPFITEGDSVNVLFWEEKHLSLEIPTKVTLGVVDTPPGVKGNSATNVYKSAKLENGLQVKVPLFVNIGDKVVIDTRTREYVERNRP